jgi:hypothetical protein
MTHGFGNTVLRQRQQFHVDRSENLRVKNKFRFPVRCFGPAWEMLIREPVQKFDRMVNIVRSTIISTIDLLQQNDVRVFRFDNVRDLVESPKYVFFGRLTNDGSVRLLHRLDPFLVS